MNPLPVDPPLDLFAGESSHSLADQFSFIDVSLEDDCLLPIADKEPMKECSNGVLHSPAVCKTLNSRLDVEAIQPATPAQDNLSGNLQGGTFSSLSELTQDVVGLRLSEEPSLKEKKKHGFNLRNSLAWNNAFLTEDGVLDSEELSLVNTTFHCIPEQEKPSAHGQISQLIKPVVIPKFSSTTAISLEKTSETPTTSSPTNLIVSLIGSGLKRSEDHPSNGHGLSGIRQGGLTKQPLTSKLKPIVSSKVDAAEPDVMQRKNGSEKRNFGAGLITSGAMETSKHEPKGRSDAFTFQSVSINGAAQPRPVGVNRKFTNLSRKAEVHKNQKATKPGCTTTHYPQNASSAGKLATPIDAPKKTPTSEKSSITSADRPSGLRMPSPKLGFFDASRMASHAATCNSENGSADQKITNRLDAVKQNHGSMIPNPLLHKSRQPVKEHSALKATEIMGPSKVSSSIMPASLHNTSNIIVPPVSGEIQGSSTTRSSSNLQGSPGTSVNLGQKEVENSTPVLQTKINVPYNISPLTKITGLFPVRDASGQENSYPDFQDSKNAVTPEKLGDQDVEIP